jgi:predicted TIM-barrel fold metal-dependent hydrolase
MTFDGPLIDAHTHIIPDNFSHEWDGLTGPDGTEMVAWMDAHGIDRAVVLPLESPEGLDRYVLTRWVLEEAAEHPERLIPFCVIDPRVSADEETREAMIRTYIEHGARGFGEVKAGVPVDHDGLRVLYRICEAEDLPVLLHIDHLRCTDDVGLPKLERMLASYPDLTFIAHAPGWWAHVSSDVDGMNGYPDGAVEPGGRCDELLAEYDNLYADLSAGSGYNAITRDPEYGQAFLERHHEKLLWATDYPAFTTDWLEERHFALFDRFDLTDDQWADIRYRNVERILQ